MWLRGCSLRPLASGAHGVTFNELADASNGRGSVGTGTCGRCFACKAWLEEGSSGKAAEISDHGVQARSTTPEEMARSSGGAAEDQGTAEDQSGLPRQVRNRANASEVDPCDMIYTLLDSARSLCGWLDSRATNAFSLPRHQPNRASDLLQHGITLS